MVGFPFFKTRTLLAIVVACSSSQNELERLYRRNLVNLFRKHDICSYGKTDSSTTRRLPNLARGQARLGSEGATAPCQWLMIATVYDVDSTASDGASTGWM